MHLKFRNVNDCFEELVRGIYDRSIYTERRPSRNGEVLQIPEPLILEFSHPRERVLFNQERDCNPFFHVVEAMWMLAGRNDVEPLKHFNSKIDFASDDGKTFNGAYGYRWRKSSPQEVYSEHLFYQPPPTTTDQISILINHLENKPESRRAVLQMWNVEDDLLKVDTSKDVCCNLSVCFLIREDTVDHFDKNDPMLAARPLEKVRYLDMTVFNRSNDLIWGTLGANYVHFTFLQEYVADCLGMEVGKYYQISNNAHVYTDGNSKFEENAERWLNWHATTEAIEASNLLDCSKLKLVEDRDVFDRNVDKFVTNYRLTMKLEEGYGSPFIAGVAHRMVRAFYHHKNRAYSDAMAECQAIEQDDWRWVATKWIESRALNWR